ncbi:C-type lectin domain family 11 member A [Bombina bombina]|uniref:C-type lectin domain family 11 member A n=1 Tax=Bombina bombina TaxID=8345 RepID=UPI00235B2C13|nr:C-type lectin domain family 11 member A [Bombina bombina]
MFSRFVLFLLLCLSQIPARLADEEMEDLVIEVNFDTENHVSFEEQDTDLGKNSQGSLEVTTVTQEREVQTPKTMADPHIKLTIVSVPQIGEEKQDKKVEHNVKAGGEDNEKADEEDKEKADEEDKEKSDEEDKEKVDEEDKEKADEEHNEKADEEDNEKADEEEDNEKTDEEDNEKANEFGTEISKNDNNNKLRDTATTAQPTTTPPYDDNFSYLLSRLSAIESAIHRLNVQFYGMDIKMTQMSQTLSKMRTKLSDAEDSIATVSEMNLRNQKQIGQIEGCLKGKRLFRKCYLIFQHFENYATAQHLCHSRGGNLAMPIDQQEYAAVAQYIHDAFFPFNWPVWIGINDLRSDGLYLYENGHRVSFFNWYKDHLVTQPNGGTVENCVSVSSDDGKWWDNDCSRRMYFICEF